jgi:hypothetical protein
MESQGIFEKFKVDAKQKKELEKLEEHQMQLEKQTSEEMIEYERTVDKLLEGNKEVNLDDLSKLDAGIERGKAYKVEITDLAESLTNELEELGQFLGDMSQYDGLLENGLAWVGLTRWADKKRMSRVKSADVKQNLETILDYGHHMVQKLYDAIIQNTECYGRLENAIVKTVDKLKVNQPIFDDWRDKKEKYQREIDEIQDKIDKATPQDAPKYHQQKIELEKLRDDAQINENNYFTIVDKSRQALPVQKDHRDSYKNLVDALTQFRTGLEQDIENVTQVYLSAPVAIQTALKTKAASQYDKGMKYATDVSTDAVQKAVAGVLDEVASRAERPLIEADKLAAYRLAQKEMRARFDERLQDLKNDYEATPIHK